MLSVVNEFDKVPVNAGMQAIAMAHIDAPPRAASNGEKRKPVNISAVIDISGSMDDGKLELVKKTLEYVLRELNGEDNLGVVAFDDRVEEAVPLRAMNADNKDAALRAIRAMAPRGSTNLSGGLFGGMAQICGDSVSGSDEHAEVQPVSRLQRPVPTRNRAPSLLDRVKSTLGLSSSHADPNAPSAAASDASSSVKAFTVTAKVSHDYVSVKKDENKVHQYFMAVTLGEVPCGLTAEVTIGGAPAALKDGKYERTVESVKGPMEFVDVRVVVKKGSKTVAEKVVKHACGVSEDGEETAEISGGSKTNTPRDGSVGSSGAQLNTIWLFTDGQANCGITDPAVLSRTVQSRLQSSKKDMTVFTFGFGRSHNASMLQAIAEVSQGSYYFIEDQPAIAGAFADCLGGLLSVVAQNVVLTIEPADERVKIEKVMTKYPTKQDGKKHVVTMKDLYGEEKRDVLVLTSLPAVGNASRLPTVKFSLQFVEAVSGRTVSEGADAVVEVTTEAVTLTPNVDVDKQRNRITVTEAMEEAKSLADGGRLNDAREKLRKCEAAVKSSGTSNDVFVGHLLEDLCRVQASCATESMYASAGQKCLNQAYSSHAQQRSNMESGAYVTSAKKSMRSKFL